MSAAEEASLDPISHAEEEDRSYLSYVGSETPRYVTFTWVVVGAILVFYTWRWYLPELSLWMGWG